jgi:aspartate kinase
MTNKSFVVLKFGGTSIGSGERLIHVSNIVKQTCEQFTPIVVLSAMSSNTKSLGTTSRLLDTLHEILSPDSSKYLEIVDDIENSHIEEARIALSQNAELSLRAENYIKAECKNLRNFMMAAEVYFY